LAQEAKAGRLLLSHLNPDHDDRAIARMRKDAKAGFRHTECAAAGLTETL
jgi:ribonuclease BN (tRNA processing enzyme)